MQTQISKVFLRRVIQKATIKPIYSFSNIIKERETAVEKDFFTKEDGKFKKKI